MELPAEFRAMGVASAGAESGRQGQDLLTECSERAARAGHIAKLMTGERMPGTHSRSLSTAGLDRYVALPFTTPLLVGTRARLRHGSSFELLVPNPAGGRGFYVIDPASLPQFCCLTLHDELLLEEIRGLESLSPAAIRNAARKVALTGAAGRRAAEAACRAIENEAAVVRLAQVLLLLKLLEAAGVQVLDPQRIALNPVELRSHLKEKLGHFLPKLGMNLDEIFSALEDIAPFAANIGFRDDAIRGRHRQTLQRLADLVVTLSAWSAVEAERVAERATRIADLAQRTYAAAMPLFHELQALLDEVVELLQSWRTDSKALKERLSAFDWLFDGWVEICNLWEAASRDRRSMQRATLEQMERLLPVSKDDISPQCRAPAEERWLQRARHVRLGEDWRTGVVINDWLRRHEKLKAGALA